MKVGWLTDIHLNFVEETRLRELLQEIEKEEPDIILIGGDIAEATDFGECLEALATLISKPIYFVLGNHDYYHGSIDAVRDQARALTRSSQLLNWLPASEVVELTDKTALVGHGGWGDARVGDIQQSDVLLNDYLLIRELNETHGFPEADTVLTPRLEAKLRQLGDEAADHFQEVLPPALEKHQHVILLTHVPPFHAACWHEGELSDFNWTPHFVCKAVGDKLREVMAEHPSRRLSVLCGHTHSGGYTKPLDNLEVYTGAAVYRCPELQKVFLVE